MLEQIIADKKKEVYQRKLAIPLEVLQSKGKGLNQPRSFGKALKIPQKISIIAEIKKASPSKGIIREDFDPPGIAKCYEKCGAAAISVLTDKKYFQGDVAFLEKVRASSSLPLLRKDFIIDSYQIFEARLAGADAILLIAKVLSDKELRALSSIAFDLGLDILLEVHDQQELDRALKVDEAIIGINNRNLKTFQVDLTTTAQLFPLIPKDRVIVSESGIRKPQQLQYLNQLGVDAVLVGEAFMASGDIAQAFQDLISYDE